jgi:hypothetical protein
MAEPGPIVKASVGIELLGPKLPEKVLLLRIRQKPPETVRDLGFSIVAVGWGAAAPARTTLIITTVDNNPASRVFSAMVNRILNPLICDFNTDYAGQDCPERRGCVQINGELECGGVERHWIFRKFLLAHTGTSNYTFRHFTNISLEDYASP